jgi:phosphatidylglycerophosphate synthase
MFPRRRWRLPEGSLGTSALTAGLVTLAVALALAMIGRQAFGLSGWYPVRAGAILAAIMLIAGGLLHDFHPFSRVGPANQVTAVRAGFVALLAALVGEPALPAAAGLLTLLMAGLDGGDGWLARRSGMASRFGARFDMEVDALLIMTLAILAWEHQKAGIWVLGSGLLRYGFVAAAALVPWLSRPLPASRRRQTICVIQVTVLAVAVVPAIGRPISEPLAAMALGALGYSFLIDVMWLWRQAGPGSARDLSLAGADTARLQAPPHAG